MSFRASIHLLSDPGIRERWTDLEKRNVLRTPFSSVGYVEDTADILGLPAKALFVRPAESDTENNTESDTPQSNSDEAGLLYLESRKSGLQHTALTGFTPFSAMAASALPTNAQIHSRESWYDTLMEALSEELPKTDLLLPPAITDMRSFQWKSWFVSPLYTFRLDVEDPDTSIKGWSESTRRLFTKWKDEYVLNDSADLAGSVVDMCLDGYDKSGRTPPLSRVQLESLANRQIGRGSATCYTLHATGETAVQAGVVVLGAPPVAFYWIAGSTTGPAMTVLIGKLLHSLSERDYTRFDLVGANTPSIAEFKRRFNPSLIPYFRVRNVRSRALRIFFTLKEALRS